MFESSLKNFSKEVIQKEWASAIKWTWVIAFAAVTCYIVIPKYSIHQGEHYWYSVNSVTGKVVRVSEEENTRKSGQRR